MNPEQLEAEIMKLSLEARARLVERILLSIDSPSDEENLRLCVLEVERRLKGLREGKAKEVPAVEVFRKERAEISFHKSFLDSVERGITDADCGRIYCTKNVRDLLSSRRSRE